MSAPVIHYSSHLEGADPTFFWRPEKLDGSAILQADVDDVDVYVFDVTDPTSPATAVYSSTGIAASSVMETSEQTGNGWPFSSGYSASITLADGDVGWEGGKTYQVELVVNTSSLGKAPTIYRHSVGEMLSQ